MGTTSNIDQPIYYSPYTAISGPKGAGNIESIGLLSGTQYGTGSGKQLLQSGVNSLDTGMGDLSVAGKYFRSLIGGDRASAEEAIGPAKDAITSQFDQIRNMFAENGPRGGGRASTLATLPFERTKAISSLINQARGQAAQGEATVGQQEGELGLGQEQAGSNLFGNSLNTLQNMRANELGYAGSAYSTQGNMISSLIGGLL